MDGSETEILRRLERLEARDEIRQLFQALPGPLQSDPALLSHDSPSQTRSSDQQQDQAEGQLAK